MAKTGKKIAQRYFRSKFMTESQIFDIVYWWVGVFLSVKFPTYLLASLARG